MTNRWLVKSEPGDYSFDDLVRDQETVWDGVRNAAALKHLETMRQGDAVLFYHTGKEKSVVGTARVRSVRGSDVTLGAGERLPHPVPLAELKRDRRLAGWQLVRLPRLSVMPVTEAQWKAVLDKASGAKRRAQ